MKLYMHPLSTSSRAIRMLVAEDGLDMEEQAIDVMSGENLKEPFISINPIGLLPALVDGDMVLTEGSAILKYLADKFNLPAYSKDLKQRAKINEAMDWFNANFYRDFAYGVVYPQVFLPYKRPTDELQSGTIEWGKHFSMRWLKVLNDHILGSKKTFLTGDTVTIADYFGAAQLSIGELIGTSFRDYPNTDRWLQSMKNCPSWGKVNEAFYDFRDTLKDHKFVTV